MTANNCHGVPIKFYEQFEPEVKLPKLARKNVAYFNKCLCGEHTIVVGDFVLVYNADSLVKETINGCDVARILLLYEIQDSQLEDTCRAIVQWYSRADSIPQIHYDSDEMTVDFEREIIEDHRPYENDISLETIYRKCKVISGPTDQTACNILANQRGRKSKLPTFVCRYKFIRSKQKRYQLVPLSAEHMDQTADALRMATNGVDFLNMAYFNNKNTVSPIRIVGGRSVVRLSQKTPNSAKGTPTATHTRPQRRASYTSACRNLTLTLSGDSPHEDCLNYSIVKTDASEAVTNDMKIKLRISHSASRRSSNLLETPKSKTERSAIDTPTSRLRRTKSMLSSADGALKRGMQLTSVEEHAILRNEETPKKTRNADKQRQAVVCIVDDEQTPSKRSMKSSSALTRTPSMKTPARAKFQTPSQKLKAFRAGEVSPVLEQRQTPRGRPKTLHYAIEQLNVSKLYKSLPCREKEFDNIYNFLRGKIEDECGGCMYISGVPGTGKTATVTTVIRTLQREMGNNELTKFEFLEINGMRLTEPRQAYVHIYRQLTGKTMPWKQAHSLLEKRFTTSAPRRLTTVLLVDELDILCNRRQDVVYNLLDWPTKSTAKLVVVTIANTMDLPERLLIGKVNSRLGLTRVTFQPYTHKQLQEILTTRLLGCGAFKNEAIQLVARKVAAVSGDARRALDICRRATEMVDYDGSEQVSISHVQLALNEMISSGKVQAIKACSSCERLFLEAIVAEFSRTGVEETTFMRVHVQVETLAALQGIRMPTVGQMLRVCAQLGAKKLIICEHSRNDIFQKLLLNVSMDDIHYAVELKPDDLL